MQDGIGNDASIRNTGIPYAIRAGCPLSVACKWTLRAPFRRLILFHMSLEQHRQQLQAEEPATDPGFLRPLDESEDGEIHPAFHGTVNSLAHLAHAPAIRRQERAPVTEVLADKHLLTVMAEEAQHEIKVVFSFKIVTFEFPNATVLSHYHVLVDAV